MGSAHDIMQKFAGRDLHAQFPEYEGWEWKVLPAAENGTVMYRVSRGYHHQEQEAILAVSLEFRPSPESVAALISVPPGRRTSRYLLVPQGADISHIPAGIHILSMASYGFADGKLTWLTNKKNAQHYPSREGTPVSTAANPK